MHNIDAKLPFRGRMRVLAGHSLAIGGGVLLPLSVCLWYLFRQAAALMAGQSINVCNSAFAVLLLLFGSMLMLLLVRLRVLLAVLRCARLIVGDGRLRIYSGSGRCLLDVECTRVVVEKDDVQFFLKESRCFTFSLPLRAFDTATRSKWVS